MSDKEIQEELNNDDATEATETPSNPASELVDLVLSGELHAANEKFNGIVEAKVVAAIEDEKLKIAQTLFAEEDDEEEEVEMDEGMLNLKKLKKQYDKNEDENQHTENYLLLAKAFGSSSDVKKVEEILKRNEKQGHTSKTDDDWMYKNLNKYYDKIRNEEVETKEDAQDDARLAFGKGADAYGQYQSMQKNPNKKAPVIKKPTLTIPKGHEIKDKQDRDRENFRKENLKNVDGLSFDPGEESSNAPLPPNSFVSKVANYLGGKR